MRRLAVAALVVAAGLAGAPAADAADPIVQPCASVSEMFETANVEMPPTHPLAGTAYRAVCKVTG